MFEINNFRKVALMEAASFLILIGMSVIKRTADWEFGVQIFGPIHGALFIGYLVLALGVHKSVGWSFWSTVLVLLGAVLPFGGFVVDRKMIHPAMKIEEPQQARTLQNV